MSEIKQLKSMPSFDLNLKVAILFGWERFPEKDESFQMEYWARFEDNHFKEDVTIYGGYLPNYVIDLNACHKLIESLSETEQRKFWENVGKIVLTGPVDRRICQCYFEKIAGATARQKCEAFILTMEKEQ